MSWIVDYRGRASVQYEELLYQTPQFVLGQLATVLLKKNKAHGLLKRGKPFSDSRDSISLTNLITYIESKLSQESVNVRGVQLRLIQSLSPHQKIIEVVTSSESPGFKSQSAQNLTGAQGGFSQNQASFLKPRPDKPKARKKVRHCFLLSYLKSDREGFVTLFAINDRAKCINTDIVLILSQSFLSQGNKKL